MRRFRFFCNILLVSNLFSYLSVFAQEQEKTFLVLSDSLIQARHTESLPISIYKSEKWRFCIQDSSVFALPDFDDSSWPATSVPNFMDSLSLAMEWKKFVWLRLTIDVDSTFFSYPWWIYYYSVSPCEIYLNGKLLGSFGQPAIQKKDEKSPVFYANSPPFIMLPILTQSDKFVLSIRWSAHSTIGISKIFPGTFKEFGPMLILRSSDPGPAWYKSINQSYLRVFFGAGLLILVIVIQGFTWWRTRRKINEGIFFVSLFFLIHLFSSHPYIFGYSLNSVVIDTLLFNPLFSLLFTLFPWLAATMLGLPLPIRSKLFSAFVIIATSSILAAVLFVGTTSLGYWVLLLGVIAISLFLLIKIILKAYTQKIPHRGIVALTYITPIFITLLAFTIQVIGNYYGFDLNLFLEKYHLFNPLIIVIYTVIPVLTTFYIAIQNIDILDNLSFLVKQRTSELELSLTELKSTQSQLIQSEKMASLGELTAGIAHEIQNPLNFVNNFSEVSNELLSELSEEVEKGNLDEVKLIAKDVQQNLEKINHHGKRADAIVKGMLQHSRSSSGAKEPTDINKLTDEYLRLAYHGLRAKDKSFNATLKTDFDDSIGNINIIPQDIGRVLLNLMSNAFYATNEKQKQGMTNYEPIVIVATSKIPSAGGGGAVISVKDNGNGIPQHIKDKIFQPFFTTKPTGQGTGLGLSLSYDIVKAHGGELRVETTENEGTAFVISLPV